MEDNSRTNIEYVVKPPKMPVKIKALRLGSLMNGKSNTMARLPIKLQRRVANGNEKLDAV